MRIAVSVTSLGTIIGIGAMIAGLASPALARSAVPSAYAGTIYVTDQANNVWVASVPDIRNGLLEAPSNSLQGVNYPVQLAIDRNGNVYIANSEIDAQNDGNITEYSAGSLAPSRTLMTGLATTTRIAVDRTGTIYASNKFAATIEVFQPGASGPSQTISQGLVGPDGLAVDDAGNLYIADSSAGRVLELPHGATAPRRLDLQGISRPIGIAVDSHRNLYVSNVNGPQSTVNVFSPGSNSPSRTFAVYGRNGSIGEVYMLSIAAHDILLASFPLSTIVDTQTPPEWEGTYAGLAAFASGQSAPLWTYVDGQYGDPYDAGFAPAH